MKRTVVVSFFAASLLLLAGCGLLSAPVTDPFGLDGQSMTFTVQDATALVAPQQQGTVQARASITVTLDDDDSIPASSTVSNTVGLRDTATVSSADGNLPATLTVTSVGFDGTLSDGVDSDAAQGGIEDDFTLTRDPACAADATSCVYAVAVPAGTTLSLDLGAVLGNDEEPNTLEFQGVMTLVSDPALSAGDTIRVTLDAKEGSGSL